MKSNHVRGRSITNDSAVLSLFQSINGMHPHLLELLNQLDERRCRCHGCGRASWGWAPGEAVPVMRSIPPSQDDQLKEDLPPAPQWEPC